MQRLAQYSPELVQITLVREKNNLTDSNAIAVVATVVGKGSAVIGYIRKTSAQVLTPVLDLLGGRLEAHLERITCANTYYGAIISFSFNQNCRERAA
ncbi:MAG: HIRAN domain-containing protein [Desulfurispora sp.]|uniref:HIRAN domain-containing protein n=1 Tax=Desulfurispora sp. TaxID=3014275 RepID=UPI00404ADCA3